MNEGSEVVVRRFDCPDFLGNGFGEVLVDEEDRGARYTGDTVGGAKLMAGTVSLEFLGSLFTYLGILGMYLVLT